MSEGGTAARPLLTEACCAADDAFYADPRNSDLFDENGNRIPLGADDPRCAAWMALYGECGGEIEYPEEQVSFPPEEPIQECPLANANIVSVEWLHGNNITTIDDAEQYVNLPRHSDWVNNDEIENEDRLGMWPRFKVTFDKPVCAEFDYELEDLTHRKSAYSSREKGEDDKNKGFPEGFVPTQGIFTGTTEADGTAIIEGKVKLVAGGGFKFRIVASDRKGKTVKSGKLTTKRLFWYRPLKMRSISEKLRALREISNSFDDHHIVLKALPELTIPDQTNIGDDIDNAELIDNVTNAIAADPNTKAHEPHAISIAFARSMARRHTHTLMTAQGVEVGPGKSRVRLPVVKDGKPLELWSKKFPAEDWFDTNLALFIHPNGQPEQISPEKITYNQNFSEVRIDVGGLPASSGRIEIAIYHFIRWRGGETLNPRLICIATKAGDGHKPKDEQARSAVHEIGHAIGMVPKGGPTEPDKPRNFYTGLGHFGAHCRTGLIDGLPDYSGQGDSATCVMYGEENDICTFCSYCGEAVSKLDLRSGF